MDKQAVNQAVYVKRPLTQSKEDMRGKKTRAKKKVEKPHKKCFSLMDLNKMHFNSNYMKQAQI